MSVEDPNPETLSIAERKAILLFGNDSFPPAFEKKKRGIHRPSFEDLSIGGVAPPPIFGNAEIEERSASALEDLEWDATADQILGYRNLKQIECSREDFPYIQLKLGKAKWSHRSNSDGFSSSYRDIKAILNASGMKDGDAFVDIGSSYGRVGCVVGVNFPNSRFLGYEIVEERVLEAKRVAQFLQLDNVNYFCQDVSADDFELPKADWFFLYDALNDATLTHIIEKIYQEEENRNARLIAKYSDGLTVYKKSPYLELVSKINNTGILGGSYIYRFRQLL